MAGLERLAAALGVLGGLLARVATGWVSTAAWAPSFNKKIKGYTLIFLANLIAKFLDKNVTKIDQLVEYPFLGINAHCICCFVGH